jgi:hypothetical protein
VLFRSLLGRILRKILFILEFRRGINLFSQTYYNGFLLEAALMDGYRFDAPAGKTATPLQNGATTRDVAPEQDNQSRSDAASQRIEAVRRLREAIRRTRYAANFKYIQRVLRETVRPLSLLKAGWLVVRGALAQLPRLLVALPGAYIRSIRETPRRIQEGARSTFRTVRGFPGQVAAAWQRARSDFYARIQALLGGEKLLGNRVIEQMSKAMEAALLKLPSDHFDALRAQLADELAIKE